MGLCCLATSTISCKCGGSTAPVVLASFCSHFTNAAMFGSVCACGTGGGCGKESGASKAAEEPEPAGVWIAKVSGPAALAADVASAASRACCSSRCFSSKSAGSIFSVAGCCVLFTLLLRCLVVRQGVSCCACPNDVAADAPLPQASPQWPQKFTAFGHLLVHWHCHVVINKGKELP